MKPWKILQSEETYSTPYFKIRQEKCQREKDQVEYYIIEKRDIAFTAAFTPENKLVLIRQYRHPVRSVNVEIPAGYLDEGETPEQAAHRELLEETGYKAENLVEMKTLYASAGGHNNSIHFFIGFNAKKVSDQNLDDLEEIEVFEASLEEAHQMLENGEIKDMGNVTCLKLVEDYLKKN